MFLMDTVLAAWPSLYPSAALTGGGFKTPPGKEGCLGFRGSLSRGGQGTAQKEPDRARCRSEIWKSKRRTVMGQREKELSVTV